MNKAELVKPDLKVETLKRWRALLARLNTNKHRIGIRTSKGNLWHPSVIGTSLSKIATCFLHERWVEAQLLMVTLDAYVTSVEEKQHKRRKAK